MFFLATVDEAGQPTCSYKGGDPGFVRITGPRNLAYPNYDGNGMYLSMGNLAETQAVGLLFIDFETQRRMRVDGRARIKFRDPLLTQYPEGQRRRFQAGSRPTGHGTCCRRTMPPVPAPNPERRPISGLAPRAVVAGAGFFAALLLLPGSARSQVDVPRLTAAGIEEGDVEFGRAAGRTVHLWVEVEDLPSCAAPGGPVEVGFLIDADRDASTHLGDLALDLGPDARVHAVCGREGWHSAVGEVRVGPGARGGTRLTIETIADRLPSSSFLWVVYARAGARAEILPGQAEGVEGPPGYAAWAILERAKP